MTSLCPQPAIAYRGVGMILEDRIRGIDLTRPDVLSPIGVRNKAATLAAEADELMREMEGAIDGMIGMYAHKHCDEAMKSDECHSACEILERYNNWKEKNQ